MSFLTNSFKLPVKIIVDIYKARWQVELFFKWIKQNLKIKLFVGSSKNSVMTQIWIALCVYWFFSSSSQSDSEVRSKYYAYCS